MSGGGPGNGGPPLGFTRSQETPEEFMRAMLGDIDPLKHAGEGWFSTEEYARPGDIMDPYVRGDVMNEGAYYPPPDPFNRMGGY